MESWQQTLANLDAGLCYEVTCPDGLTRILWGANRQTGDLFVAGWDGDVWGDCSAGYLRCEFEGNGPRADHTAKGKE